LYTRLRRRLHCGYAWRLGRRLLWWLRSRNAYNIKEASITLIKLLIMNKS
jgi:hypothetical protein